MRVSKKKKRGYFLRAQCHYCGGRADTKDHYIPTALGGTSDLNNLVPACEECNRVKDCMIPEAFFQFCAEVVLLKSPRHDGFRAKARATLLRHAPDLIPDDPKQRSKIR